MTRRFFSEPVVVLALIIGLCCTCFLIPVRGASPKAAKNAKSEPAAAAAALLKFGNAEAISPDDLRNFLYFLASDQLEGRNAPSRGFDTAALFVASHLAEWGLKPGGSASGTTNGPLQPYFMPMELLAKTVIPGESKASITAPASGRGGRRAGGGETAPDNGPRTTTFEYGKDWNIAGGGRGAAPLDSLEIADANLVFVGNGYVIEKSHADPFAGLDVKGKIVVVAGIPPELTPAQGRAGRGGGGQANDESTNATNPAAAARGAALNALGEACKDYMTPAQAAAKDGAAAVISLVTFQELSGAGGSSARFGSELNGPAYRVPKLAPTTACKSVPSITAQLSLANALFQGEKFSAQQVFYGAGSGTKQESFELTAAKKLTLKVATKSESNHVENVIGMLEGSDPVLKNEYVVMSAHLDHTGFSAPLPNGHNVNNGADDDGSGSAGLMAIAKAYAEGAAKGIRPKRSMIFLWAAGEEKGLWGSQYFNEYPPVDLSKVVADLNMDMIGRTKGPDFKDSDQTHVLVSPGEVLVIGPQVSSSDLDKTLETVNDSYQKLKINHFYDVTKPDDTHDNLGPQPRGQRIFYRSDHYNFAKMGIPIAFFTTGLHPDYHRPTDTPDKIDYKEMQIIAKTVAAVAWHLGTQEGRPKVNMTLPEQLQKDMKLVKEQNWGQVTPVLAPLPHMPF